MIKNKKNIIHIILFLLFVLFAILGFVGYYNNYHKNSDNIDENPQNIVLKPISEEEMTKRYYENLEYNMNLYFKNKNGYFVGTAYNNNGEKVVYKIDDKYDLYLLNTDNNEIYVDSDVVFVDFYNCGEKYYSCLNYIKKDQTKYAIEKIFGKKDKYESIDITNKMLELEDDIPIQLSVRYFKEINNVKEGINNVYRLYYDSGKILTIYYEDYFSKAIFSSEYTVETFVLKQSDKIIGDDVIETKVLYSNDTPMLYYWKSDGYWYRYDYYNKEEPITTKIDLDYIIDVRQFTYDTGETITLFVDIEGNLKEFTE